jgi:Uma2 family endonuclease
MSAGESTTASDPFRLGWRFVRETGPDGQEVTRQVPLTEHDLLFPQEEDHVMQRDPHTRDMLYLREAFRVILRNRPAVHVFADHRIDFNLHGVAPLGPDVAIIDQLPDWDGSRGTFRLAEQGKALLVVEITSPDTRRNDLTIKRQFYERAGVPVYITVDRQAGETGEEVTLIVLRLNGEGYHELEADDQGRVRLPQFGISIGIEDDRVWLYQRGGTRIEEMPRLYDLIESFQQQIDQADQQREQMQTQMEQEIDLRRSESRSRREAELRAEQAETQLQKETEARQEAEARALQAEARMRELEELLRRAQGSDRPPG